MERGRKREREKRRIWDDLPLGSPPGGVRGGFKPGERVEALEKEQTNLELRMNI